MSGGLHCHMQVLLRTDDFRRKPCMWKCAIKVSGYVGPVGEQLALHSPLSLVCSVAGVLLHSAVPAAVDIAESSSCSKHIVTTKGFSKSLRLCAENVHHGA